MAVECPLQLVHHQREEALEAPIRSRDVRAEEDVREILDRAVGGDRLGVEDVEARDDVAALHPYFAGLGEPERERAWAEVARALRRFEGPDGYAAPGEVLVAVGTR